ncbi:MAG: hypothetical protein Ta2B_01840 [Termitinemataceae bacterium]|nr:MAG: hypothetical protein Ta2B_01840 [Termitinemataceae bacterium]
MADFIYKDKYIWDENKNEMNKRDHFVSFEAASEVLEDFLTIEIYDRDNSISEDRYNVTGLYKGSALMTVSVTYTNIFTRIFSARNADSEEIGSYNAKLQKFLS